MSKPGPKPKPTKIHELEGGQKKRHRPMPDHEPQPKTTEKPPRAPSYLDKRAQKEWRRIVKELYPIGLLTKIDFTALAGYCSCYSLWLEAQGQIKKHGTLIKGKLGFPTQSPYLIIANKAMTEMRKWLVEFGMTPSSRSRVTTELPKDTDPIEDFLKKGGKPYKVK